MPFDEKSFVTTRDEEPMFKELRRLSSLDVQSAMEYLRDVSSRKAQIPETCVHISVDEKRTLCGHVLEPGVQYIESLYSASLANCATCAELFIKAASR